ncbi:MAG: protein tyrosine phosphatase, partial [Acidocella sp. 20-61-6]
GADRAGLASAIFMLLDGKSAAQAQAQLSLRFGHLRHAKSGILDQFIAAWARTGEGRKPFLQWVAEDYDAAALQAGFKTNPVARFLNERVLVRE